MKADRELSAAWATLRETMDLALRWFKAQRGLKTRSIRRKLGLDITTDADVKLQNKICQIIRRNHPHHSILAEEGQEVFAPATLSGDSDDTDGCTWIVDPIDGTINFAAGLPLYAVSVAFQRRGTTELGGIAVPHLERVYTVWRGRGAWLRRRRVRVAMRRLEDAVVSVILTSHFSELEIERTCAIIRLLASHVRGLRIFVSQALELACIAEGLLDGNICIKADPFGSAAGALLVEEAGGRVTALDGSRWTIETASIVAANPIIHDALLETCQQALQQCR